MNPQNLQTLSQYTAEELRRLRPHLYSDQDLLDLADSFTEEADDERANAVYEAILQSSECDEDIVYEELYEAVVRYWLDQGNWAVARRWAYAWLAYRAQQDFLSQEEVKVETQDES
ncbi:MAG: hypothetical protein NZP34_07825, partial [Caldilineales bacterium]|nr:hypothetical protein [Caldilineales bacterium]